MGSEEDKLKEKQWIRQPGQILLVLITLAAGLSLPYFRKLNELLNEQHPVIVSALSGFIVFVFTYPAAYFADRKYSLSISFLMGLLVSEFTAFGAPPGFPTPVAISFMFFMFYYGYAEADILWPTDYNGFF